MQYVAHFALVRLTKFLLTEVTQLLRSSRPKQPPVPSITAHTPGTPLVPPSVQIQRQYSDTPRTPLGLTPDQVRYFYPE
jgi:hypothetical protein